MKSLRYLKNVATVEVDEEICVGCSLCTTVCPHQVFGLQHRKAVIMDRDGCMECGACAVNCPVNAIRVHPGVGCASLIVSRWLRGKNIDVGGCC